jgi:hypothetical protein
MVGTLLYPLKPEEIKSLQDATDSYLINRAIETKIATSPSDLIVRDLLPGTDLNGTSGEVWVQVCSAYQYNTAYSGKNPSTKMFAIFGVKNKNATPRTAALRFKVGAGGAKVKDIWQIEQAYLESNTAVFTSDPIKYEKQETFVIENYGVTSGEDGVILLGRVVEPRNETITG